MLNFLNKNKKYYICYEYVTILHSYDSQRIAREGKDGVVITTSKIKSIDDIRRISQQILNDFHTQTRPDLKTSITIINFIQL